MEVPRHLSFSAGIYGVVGVSSLENFHCAGTKHHWNSLEINIIDRDEKIRNKGSLVTRFSLMSYFYTNGWN